jgi:anti-anti-sigma regulatory factor
MNRSQPAWTQTAMPEPDQAIFTSQDCRVWSQDGLPVVSLPVEVYPDLNAPLVRHALFKACAEAPVVIVDMTITRVFSAAGYNALVAARNEQQRTGGGEIWLAAPNDTARKVLTALRLDELFPVFISVQEALTWHHRELAAA